MSALLREYVHSHLSGKVKSAWARIDQEWQVLARQWSGVFSSPMDFQLCHWPAMLTSFSSTPRPIGGGLRSYPRGVCESRFRSMRRGPGIPCGRSAPTPICPFPERRSRKSATHRSAARRAAPAHRPRYPRVKIAALFPSPARRSAIHSTIGRFGPCADREVSYS